ncbi:MAG: response regulator transcription factor [Lachnospiraceae bacterium]|nr:response regulator transcription factor [Lachnospiraceae bacterium]
MTTEKTNSKLVLLVEDNEKILYGNKRMLEWAGYTIETALTLAQARQKLGTIHPDCIVLDIMLPDGNGLKFMKELRQSINAGIPVLLLTGLNTQEDILRGLKSGGDDYLTKPYDMSILLARLEALIRRSKRVPEQIHMEPFTLDISSGIAMLNGSDLLLAQKEFALLLIFVQHPSHNISGEYLYEKVWGQPMEGNTNALKSTIKRLRDKTSGSGWQITWTRGEGYCFECE